MLRLNRYERPARLRGGRYLSPHRGQTKRDISRSTLQSITLLNCEREKRARPPNSDTGAPRCKRGYGPFHPTNPSQPSIHDLLIIIANYPASVNTRFAFPSAIPANFPLPKFACRKNFLAAALFPDRAGQESRRSVCPGGPATHISYGVYRPPTHRTSPEGENSSATRSVPM